MNQLNTTATPAFAWATSAIGKPASLHERRDIVVIGAAMGGLSALCKLLNRLPPTFDAAVLIALDIGSQPAPVVLQILRSYSRFPVSYAVDGALVRRWRVVVAPARHHMRVAQPGILALEAESAFAASSGPSVNGLFKTAAAAYGRRVVGVVLSGASHDGTAGLSLIEAAGGVGVVQDPDEAVDASMPSSALRGDHPNYCSPLDQMAPLIARLVEGQMPADQLVPRNKAVADPVDKERQ